MLERLLGKDCLKLRIELRLPIEFDHVDQFERMHWIQMHSGYSGFEKLKIDLHWFSNYKFQLPQPIEIQWSVSTGVYITCQGELNDKPSITHQIQGIPQRKHYPK